jgi:hypothetical protein
VTCPPHVLLEDVEEHLTDERTRFVVVSLMSPEATDPTRYVLPLDEFENMFRAGDSATVLQTAYVQQQQENELVAEVADSADGRKGAEDSELIGQVQSGQD